MSTPTTNLRLEQQALGANLNTWGDDRLNQVLRMVDAAIAGQVAITLTGTDHTLTTVNYTTDEARQSALILTGTLSASVNVIVPASYTKLYFVVNNTVPGGYTVTIKTAIGTGVVLRPGPQVVWSDGNNVNLGWPSLDQVVPPAADVDFNGYKITGLATPTANTDGATKRYVDLAAFVAVPTSLPSQTGETGKFLSTDGTNMSWQEAVISKLDVLWFS